MGKPIPGSRGHFFSPPFPAFFDIRLWLVEIVIINIETLVEPKARFQEKTAHEGPRPVPLAAEELSQADEFRLDDEIGIVVDPMIKRRRAKKDAGVGGQSCWRVGKSPREDDALFEERVEVRCLEVSLAVETDPIGPEGINSDEEQVELGSRLG